MSGPVPDRYVKQPLRVHTYYAELNRFTSIHYADYRSLGGAIGVHPRTLARWVKHYQMPHVKFAAGTRYALVGFDLDEVQKWLTSRPDIFAGLRKRPLWPVRLKPG